MENLHTKSSFQNMTHLEENESYILIILKKLVYSVTLSPDTAC